MLVGARSLQKGDTLIEVLFAVAVFSLVAVGALSIMNSSIATAQRALEISLVREQMDAQAETLRYIHDSYVVAYPSQSPGGPSAEWASIMAKVENQASEYGQSCTASAIALPSGASPFIVNPYTAKLDTNGTTIKPSPQTYSQVNKTSPGTISAEGIWVEAVKLNAASKYVDFHIRACWYSLGLSAPMTLGTIVRLYEP